MAGLSFPGKEQPAFGEQQVHNAVWLSLSGRVLPAVYPTYLGFLVQPLALLDVTTLRVVRVSFMTADVIVAAGVLARRVPNLTGLRGRMGLSLFVTLPPRDRRF